MKNRKKTRQLSLDLFRSSLESLDKCNRWVALADRLRWDEIETAYRRISAHTEEETDAAEVRRLVGACLVKQSLSLSDYETACFVQENPYVQYLCGYGEFTEGESVTPLSVADAYAVLGSDYLKSLLSRKEQKAGKPSAAGPEADEEHDTMKMPMSRLVAYRYLSVRTANALLSAGYPTLQSIIGSVREPESLLRIHGFGKHALTELLNMLPRFCFGKTGCTPQHLEYEALGDEFLSAVGHGYAVFMEENAACAEAVRVMFPSARALHNAVIAGKVYGIIPGISKDENIALRRSILGFMQTVKAATPEISPVYKLYEDRIAETTARLEQFGSAEVLSMMKPPARRLAEARFDDLCRGLLSSRARGLFSRLEMTLEKFVPFLDKEKNRFNELCPGQVMKKTIGEVFEMAQTFKPVFAECAAMSAEEVEAGLLKRQLPFLNDEQLRHVLLFRARENRLPLFYVLLWALRNSRERDVRVFALYHGLCDGRRHTVAEIATEYAVSQQRIQQILAHNARSVSLSVVQHKADTAYETLNALLFLTPRSEQYRQINSAEGLDCDFPTFAALLTALGSFNLEKVCGHSIAMKSPVRLRDVVRVHAIDAAVAARYAGETRIPLENFAEGKTCDETLRDLLRTLFEEYYGIGVDDEGRAVFRQNIVDVGRELYLLLEQNGRPMSLAELFQQFKEKFPDHKYTRLSQLSPAIFAHEHIRCIGKSKTYGLDTWKDIPYVSIRDMLFQLVSESEEPVPLSELETRVCRHFPRTNAQSLLSNMLLDEQHRFVRFEDNTMGIRGRRYAGEKKEAGHRSRFDERIRAYRDFVDKNRRVPLSQGSDEEGSLFRWRYNVEHGIISLNDTQRTAFDNLMNAVRATGHPQNAAELALFKRCEECRTYIETNRRFPPPTSSLCQWMKRMRKTGNVFTDNRRTYLANLFAYLDSVGFY